MKYSSTNRLEDFEFHDSKLSFVLWDDSSLIVTAKHLNVHRDSAPNNTGADMEISEARITFYGIKIKEFEPSRIWNYVIPLELWELHMTMDCMNLVQLAYILISRFDLPFPESK